MDREQAQRNVRKTLENPFDKGEFTNFVKDLLNSIEDAPFTYKGNFIPDAYEQHVSALERIGKYSDGKNKIDILVVKLKKETSIDRARTMQRNFIAWYLNGSRGGEQKDAALVAFVSPDQEDWRFSLVKMDYRFEEGKDGRMKVKEEFTPARRWSFLVGVNEKSHTAQSRLAPIMADDEHSPVLAELEEAFNIETVTKEFFGKYKELFLWVKDTLDKIVSENKAVKEDFAANNVNTTDFSKKLLGQIVFLYFLQKKGWFGVARDAAWGTGPKNFLRELFGRKHGGYANFFNDILEPLFYEALARERDGDFYSRFNCKIPFLNGGLFDPIGGYDWVHTDILLPDELFSNDHKTNGDNGNGILDIFDRYNFTVKEDEPLEKEVAVDPEMLGKVFENLLEVKDRKSKGTYYTPREIVHYMCRQSLINYLETQLNGSVVAYQKLGQEQPDLFGNKAKTGQLDLTMEHTAGAAIPKEDIEKLIQTGEQLGENDAIALEKLQRILEGKQKTSTIKTMIPNSIRENAKLIDDKLADIKVCDPAIGSGAFPVGMMSEIVKTRNVLSNFIKEPDRTIYHFKRQCIEKSIYGVDIDPGAVEIAKLRLWLSLVVDEDDIREIKPLPNLDYKIVCGNSLDSVEGRLEHSNAFIELEPLKKRYFDETSPGQKKEEKKKIDEVINKLTGNREKFDYKIFFSEVFDHGGHGFDVIIANPPYVRQEAIKEIKPMLSKQFGKFYCGTADLYTYFYKRGIDILKQNGHLCFIAPNKFMRAGYGKNIRELLAQKVTPKTVIDFCDLPIFDATTYPSILLVENSRPVKEQTTLVATFTDTTQLERIEETLDAVGFSIPLTALRKDGWTLERPAVLALMEKLRKAGTPLDKYVRGRFYRGILTGLNEAFVIDEATKERLIGEDAKSAGLIKPWLRGRDIKRWKANWSERYLITIPSSANKEWPWSNAKTEKEARSLFNKTYPAIHRHLSQWSDKLIKRDDQGQFWWELRSCAYYEEFEGPKIIYPNITKTNVFAFDTTGRFTNQKCFIIPTNDLYLLSVLNSKVGLQWFTKALPLLRGGFFEPSTIFMKDFPIPHATSDQKAPIIALVNQILTAPDSPDVPRLEADIDRLVYDLYNLTPAEIAIVEDSHASR